MSQLKGVVGKWELSWKAAPHGSCGVSKIEVRHPELQPEVDVIEVHWRRDSQGLWIESEQGLFGFDIGSEISDEGRAIYRLQQRNSASEWENLSFLRAGEELSSSAASAKKPIRVRAQMPGKIIRILVKPGQKVEKGQPLAMMEAMKMENEIRAASGGEIEKIAVSEGQAVETGADLLLIKAV